MCFPLLANALCGVVASAMAKIEAASARVIDFFMRVSPFSIRHLDWVAPLDEMSLRRLAQQRNEPAVSCI
jgi:hypothetical protein